MRTRCHRAFRTLLGSRSRRRHHEALSDARYDQDLPYCYSRGGMGVQTETFGLCSALGIPIAILLFMHPVCAWGWLGWHDFSFVGGPAGHGQIVAIICNGPQGWQRHVPFRTSSFRSRAWVVCIVELLCLHLRGLVVFLTGILGAE
jgi:hypothetical protein